VICRLCSGASPGSSLSDVLATFFLPAARLPAGDYIFQVVGEARGTQARATVPVRVLRLPPPAARPNVRQHAAGRPNRLSHGNGTAPVSLATIVLPLSPLLLLRALQRVLGAPAAHRRAVRGAAVSGR
jgi:hypothetical protein